MSEAPNTLTASPTATTTVLPQLSCPLTEKFTETETARVHLLITSLPLIFEEAFKDCPDQSLKTTPADFWGVPIDPLKSADHDPRVSVILVKFLRARSAVATFGEIQSQNQLNQSLLAGIWMLTMHRRCSSRRSAGATTSWRQRRSPTNFLMMYSGRP